jgi:hypothetical protein
VISSGGFHRKTAHVIVGKSRTGRDEKNNDKVTKAGEEVKELGEKAEKDGEME